MSHIIDALQNDLDYYFSEALNKPFAKPYWVFISLSHKCNFNCKMCGVKEALQDHELDIELIKKSLDEVAGWGTDCTVLFTGGEIFLRRDVFEIIQYSVSLGLKTEAVTNGSLINSSYAERIMASGLYSIAVSLDGATAPVHDFIRATEGAYTKALAAIRHLSEEKKRRGGQGPQISMWVTIMKENVHELADIIPLARELGVECLVYHPVIVAQADMQNTVKGGHLWITADAEPALKQQIDKLVAYKNESGMVAFLHDPYQWLGYFQGSLTKKDWKCNPFVFINIGPDGFVRSCGPAFGNIKGMSLTDCLQTDAAKMARERMRLCDKPCLQTCWARPGTDSLSMIISNFMANVDKAALSKEEKINAIEAGMKLVANYEKIVLQ